MTLPKHSFKYYIGIDCGVNTGIGIWSREKKCLVMVGTMTIMEAINYVHRFVSQDKGSVLVRVEDPRLRKWIPRQKTEKAERGRNRGAGSVMRDCQIWEEFLTDEGIPFELVPPKNNKTKVKADYFKKLTGWTGLTNEHGRDAAMLVCRYENIK